MDTVTTAPAVGERQLVLDRRFAASRARLWRCRAEPDLLVRWYTPSPWTKAADQLDALARTL
jgi:uncharacterized protein YndB with AHSA1/START domain